MNAPTTVFILISGDEESSSNDGVFLNASDAQKALSAFCAKDMYAGDYVALQMWVPGPDGVLIHDRDKDQYVWGSRGDGADHDRDDYADPGDMDGDAESALASAGFGTDEDYGFYGDDDGF